MKTLPKIVIVGRPNVGKSSLLNALAGRTLSIVAPIAGVTRDRISSRLHLPAVENHPEPMDVEVIDTGGYGLKETDHDQPRDITTQVEQQIELGLRQASLVVLVTDSQTGVVALDQQIAQMLRKSLAVSAHQPPVLVVGNKADTPAHEAGAYEAARLGFGEPLPVSATTKNNLNELRQQMRDALGEAPPVPEAPPEVETGPLLAIVGKRNAGKSTLVNALAGEARVIVSEHEGTTRDSVDVTFEVEGRTFTAIDTAGVRKRKSVSGDIEFYSYHRSLRSLRRADVCLLLIDATLPISQVDKQLGNELLKHYKPTVVVINKWDLAEQTHTEEEYVDYLDKELKGFSFAPIAFISAQQSQGLRDLAAMALNLHEQSGHRVGTGELNRMMERFVEEHPPTSRHGKRLKIYYVSQLEVHPPTVGLFVNNPELFTPQYERYLVNRLRDEAPFSEVPIRLVVRGRSSAPKEDR